MLRSFRIQDFQSLADVELELGHLTAIIGPTNTGKSAVVRALQAALLNWSGGEFIRRDCPDAWVTLMFDRGDVRWQKPRKGGAEYHVNGQVITRVGKEMPPEIEQVTGVRVIEGEGFKALLQVDAQFDEPFLLSSTGGQAAKLLARVSKLDSLVGAQVMVRRDMDRARKAAEQAEAREADLRERLDAQPDYEALLTRWEALRQRYENVTSDEVRLGKALALATSLRECRVQHTALLRRVGVLERITPMLADARRLSTAVPWMDKLVAARAQLLDPAKVEALEDRLKPRELVAGLLQEAARLVERLSYARTEVGGREAAVETASRKWAEAEKAFHDVMAAEGVCPLCGQAIE